MKSTRDVMDIVNAYAELGSYRGAAALCGTTHKTVKRIVARQQRGAADQREDRVPRPRNTEGVRTLIMDRVQATDGRITAKRLLPVAQAAGYTGSARALRRAVAEVKAVWRRQRRTYRPWVPVPGEHLVIDWGTERGLHLFCAVLPWSRYRFVRIAADERQETTLRLLSECCEEIGGVPAVVLADRMACLRAGTVANVVVPHPTYIELAVHDGFRPDFCFGAGSRVEGSRGSPGGLCPDRSGHSQRRVGEPGGGECGGAGLVRRGQWAGAFRDRRHSCRAAGH